MKMTVEEFRAWKRKKYVENKTDGRDEWESGYNVGFEAALLEAFELCGGQVVEQKPAEVKSENL